jgi:hypothetical protein
MVPEKRERRPGGWTETEGGTLLNLFVFHFIKILKSYIEPELFGEKEGIVLEGKGVDPMESLVNPCREIAHLTLTLFFGRIKPAPDSAPEKGLGHHYFSFIF